MGVLEIITGIEQLAAEGWTRYFMIIGGVALLDNIAGGLVGIYPLKSLIETIIHLFVPEFYFPVFFGVSSLLIFVVCVPIFLFLINASFH